MARNNNKDNDTEGEEETSSDTNGKEPQQRGKGRGFAKTKNREDYEYVYKTVSMTLNHDEEAMAKKALEIAKNHYSDTFTRVQLNTVQSLIKAIAFMYFEEFIEAWEKSQQKKKNGGEEVKE